MPAPSEGCKPSGNVKVGLESSVVSVTEELSILPSEDEARLVNSGVGVINNEPLDISASSNDDDDDNDILEDSKRGELVLTTSDTSLTITPETRPVALPAYNVDDERDVD